MTQMPSNVAPVVLHEAARGGAREAAAAPRDVPIWAWYFEDVIDLKRFRAANPQYPVVAQDPLIIEIERDRYAILEKFGSVVFWNYSSTAARTLRDEIYAFISDRSFDERIEEQVKVVVGAEKDEVRPDLVRLVQADVARISIVARAIAQSVALDHLETRLQKSLEALLEYIEPLRTHGRVPARVREIQKRIGWAVSTKHAVITNLTLFDKPDQTWESPALETLYRGLYDETFDLHDRVQAVNRTLDFLEEVVRLFLDLVQTRRMVFLEAAIVALIVFEIVFFFAIS